MFLCDLFADKSAISFFNFRESLLLLRKVSPLLNNDLGVILDLELDAAAYTSARNTLTSSTSGNTSDIVVK